MTSDPTTTFTFGPYALQPVRRLLLRDGEPVQIGSRAFDVLTLLLERAGDVVSKEELLARAWPRTFVEESNLRVHISVLRKVLRETLDGVRYIDNVAGRGYSFVGLVSALGPAPGPLRRGAPLAPPQRLAARLVGRGDELDALGTALSVAPLLTLVGPGGVGKTALALAAARRYAPDFPDGVFLAELGAIRDPSQAREVLAAAVELPAEARLEAICDHLRARRALVILDSCEHLGDAPARLAAALLAGAPGVNLLATSREALGLPEERVHALAPLALPLEGSSLEGVALESYGALALFAQCAAGALAPGQPGPAELALIARICRRLDGLPLAIELAAARVPMLGLHGVDASLGDSLDLLSRSRPGGEPRHQSLRDVLDWSYALLSPGEQRMLRCLSVYRASFTIDCARAVCAAAPEPFEPAALYNLAARSLLVCEYDGAEVRYRMLETTRVYAASRLAQAGEHDAVLRAYALRCIGLMAVANGEREGLEAARWQARYGVRLDDLRAALDWCFGPTGDTPLGVQLAAAGTLLWNELSLLEELRAQVLRALPHAREPQAEMLLQTSLGGALVHLGYPPERAVAAFSRAYELARSHGDSAQLTRTYAGLCFNHIIQGQYPQAMALSHAFAPYRNKARDRIAEDIHDRVMAATLHFQGEQRQARFHAERIYRLPRSTQRGAGGSSVQYDGKAASSAILARVRWLTGHAEEAAALALESVERAQEIEHPASLCLSLALTACPVAFWNGDQQSAAYFSNLLCERSQAHGLQQWQSWAEQFRALASGTYPQGAPPLMPGPQAETMHTILPGLAGPADFARVGQGLAGWCAAELTRQKAVWMRTAGRPAAQAEAELMRAACFAESQGALAWLLRIAITRAQWAQGTPRLGQALQQLYATLRRFPPGFPARGQREAQALLDAAGSPTFPFHPASHAGGRGRGAETTSR
ncbi:hypothetical protein B0920_06460 [Massilia sp. KIM]|uniref:ATP-binding protein n=1 Tax=Massilia sp. KIM TaxID=1955422 RepID=UPI0009901AA9|nr:winged helix-turn-helix domain-containing protein [Massilia sp. KIM]OON63054.1 hypothetical protein B0920_06460 [Massilia sp. KIM]